MVISLADIHLTSAYFTEINTLWIIILGMYRPIVVDQQDNGDLNITSLSKNVPRVNLGQ